MDSFVEKVEIDPVNFGGCGFFIVSKAFAKNVHIFHLIF